MDELAEPTVPDLPDLPDDDQELTLALPEWLRATIERRRSVWTLVDTVAAAAFVLHLILLAVIVGRGSLYLDDLRVQAEAHQASLLGYVTDPASGPFAPLPGLLDWLLAHHEPLAHWPAALLSLIVRAALAIAFWRLLRRLFGPKPAVVLPFAALLLTPALLPATTWYRPSITVLAAVAAAVWALDSFVAWQLERRRRTLATIFVATLLACCGNLIGVAVPVVLIAVQLVVLGRGSISGAGSDDRRSAPGLRAAVPALGLSVLAVALFLVGYPTGSGARVGAGSSGQPTASLPGLAWDALVRNLLPSLIGGPFDWSYPRIYSGTPDPSSTVVAFAGIVLLVGLGLSLRRSVARTVRALVLAAVLVATLTLVVGLGRPDAVGPLFTRADALAVGLVPVVLLAFSLAAIPRIGQERTVAGSPAEQELVERARLAGIVLDPAPAAAGDAVSGGQAPLTRRQLRERRSGAIPVVQPPHRPVGQQADQQADQQVDQQVDQPGSSGPAGIEIGVPAIAAALVVLAIVVGSLASTVTYTRKWWDNPTGIWLSRMQANLVGAEAYPRILATPLPSSMFPDSESRVFPSSAPLLQMIRPDVRFHDGDGQARTMTASGDLVAPLVTTLGESRKSELCVATIRDGQRNSRWIRLSQDAVYSPGSQVGIGVLVNESGRVEVKVRTPQGEVLTPMQYGDDELPAGPHTLHFPVPYGATVRWVQVVSDVRSTTCVSSAQVWAPYA